MNLCELLSVDETAGQQVACDSKRGNNLFHKHVAACILCHSLKGQGSTVGPALDGIATRGTPTYIRESLLEPGKVLAKATKLSRCPPCLRWATSSAHRNWRTLKPAF